MAVDPIEAKRRKLEEAARKRRETEGEPEKPLTNTLSNSRGASPAEDSGPLARERLAVEMERARLDMERAQLERDRSALAAATAAAVPPPPPATAPQRRVGRRSSGSRPAPPSAGPGSLAAKSFVAGCFGITGVIVGLVVVGVALFAASLAFCFWAIINGAEAEKALRVRAEAERAKQQAAQQAIIDQQAAAERAEEDAKQEARNEQFARDRAAAKQEQATDELADICEVFGGTLDPRRFVEAQKRLDDLGAAWTANKIVSGGVAQAKRIASAQRRRVINAGLERAQSLKDSNIIEAVDVVAALEELGLELSPATKETIGPILYERLESMRGRRRR